MSDRIQEIKERYSENQRPYLNAGQRTWDDIQYLLGLVESLQRETEPVPLTFNQLSERVGKPVFVGVLERWEIIDFIKPELFHIHMRSGNIFRFGATRLYATEPKGEPHD